MKRERRTYTPEFKAQMVKLYEAENQEKIILLVNTV
jgi:transposase-like protein